MTEQVQTNNDAPSVTNATMTMERQTRVTDEMMAEQMSRLTKEALVELLDRYGYVAEPETPKAKLIQAILSLHQKQIKDSEDVVKKATAEIAAANDPIVRMKFMSLESPNASYEFTYAGPNGFKLDGRGNAMPAPKWHFFHNRSYDVPYSVVKHLNSLKVPADVQVQTDAQGFIQSLYSGDTNRQPRFSCTIELTSEQELAIIQKG